MARHSGCCSREREDGPVGGSPARGRPDREGPARWAALGRAAALGVLVSGFCGCAKARARTEPAPPPMEVPAPPPRVIVPLPAESVASVTPPPEEAPAPRPAPRVQRAAPPRADREPAPAVTPKPSAESSAPSRSLQTTASATGTEQDIRALLARASQDLGRVEYRTLSAEARAQYDIARRFIAQAEDGLKDRNLVFAAKLADKAAALAALLLTQ